MRLCFHEPKASENKHVNENVSPHARAVAPPIRYHLVVNTSGIGKYNSECVKCINPDVIGKTLHSR